MPVKLVAFYCIFANFPPFLKIAAATPRPLCDLLAQHFFLVEIVLKFPALFIDRRGHPAAIVQSLDE